MAGPEDDERLGGRATDLELEKNLAPKNSRAENERAARRLVEFSWWLVGFRRNFIEDFNQPLADFLTDQPEVEPHFVDELARATRIAPLLLALRNLDRLIRWVAAKKPFLENLITLFSRILREMSVSIQPLRIGNPAVSKLLASEGTHPFHLIRYHMIP